MRKASMGLQELRRKIYSKAKTDRWIGFVAKRTGKPYEGKSHVRFDEAGDGKVLRRA